jgi:hypothetical protein
MHPLEEYIRELRDLRRSGAATREQSYYPARKNLLDAVGDQLKPRVRCIQNPANIGAGIPDLGLYTYPDQFAGAESDTPMDELPPVAGTCDILCDGSEEKICRKHNPCGD